MSDIPINGNVCSWQSLDVKGDGVALPQLQALDYEQPLSRKKVYGTPAQPIGRTLGKLDPKGSIKMLKQDFHDYINRLGEGWQDKEFEITANWQANEGDPIISDLLLGVKLNAPKQSNAPGEDPTIVELELDIMEVRWSGLRVLKNMLG